MKKPEDVIKSFGGRMIRKDAQIIMIYKVRGKYYPDTQANSEAMDAYLHTGDQKYLENLEKEVEL